MRRIDRYLLSEIVVPFLIGAVLVLVLKTADWLYGLFRILYASSPPADVLLILAYRMPLVIKLAVPAGLLLGAALGLNRLEHDRELMALRMAGIPLFRLITPYLIVGALASGLLFWLQETVIPGASHQAERLTRKLAFQSPAGFVHQDVVMKLDSQNYVYVREVDPRTQTLNGVLLCRREPDSVTFYSIPAAENRNGVWFLEPDPITKELPQFWTFDNKGGVVRGQIEGPGSWFNLRQDALNFMTDQISSPDEVTLRGLLDLRKGVRGYVPGSLSMTSLYPNRLAFYVHRRIADPLTALIGILIAIPLAVHFGRSGGYVGLLLSAALAFCFVVSQQWTQVLAENELLDPVLAAWAPNAIFGLSGVVMLLFKK